MEMTVTLMWKVVKKLPLNFNIYNNAELEAFFNPPLTIQ
jgi:hypothetical protein